MFIAGGNDVNSGCVDTAVTENIGKLGNVLFNPVKCAGKQMPQVMRKDLFRVYPRLPAKAFHLPPDIGAVHRFSCAGDKYSA